MGLKMNDNANDVCVVLCRLWQELQEIQAAPRRRPWTHHPRQAECQRRLALAGLPPASPPSIWVFGSLVRWRVDIFGVAFDGGSLHQQRPVQLALGRLVDGRAGRLGPRRGGKDGAKDPRRRNNPPRTISQFPARHRTDETLASSEISERQPSQSRLFAPESTNTQSDRPVHRHRLGQRRRGRDVSRETAGSARPPTRQRNLQEEVRTRGVDKVGAHVCGTPGRLQRHLCWGLRGAFAVCDPRRAVDAGRDHLVRLRMRQTRLPGCLHATLLLPTVDKIKDSLVATLTDTDLISDVIVIVRESNKRCK